MSDLFKTGRPSSPISIVPTMPLNRATLPTSCDNGTSGVWTGLVTSDAPTGWLAAVMAVWAFAGLGAGLPNLTTSIPSPTEGSRNPASACCGVIRGALGVGTAPLGIVRVSPLTGGFSTDGSAAFFAMPIPAIIAVWTIGCPKATTLSAGVAFGSCATWTAVLTCSGNSCAICPPNKARISRDWVATGRVTTLSGVVSPLANSDASLPNPAPTPVPLGCGSWTIGFPAWNWSGTALPDSAAASRVGWLSKPDGVSPSTVCSAPPAKDVMPPSILPCVCRLDFSADNDFCFAT